MPTEPLVELVQEFARHDPATVARRLEAMRPEQAALAVRSLPNDATSSIFPHFQVTFAASILAALDPADFEVIVQQLDAERAAAVFTRLPDDIRETFVPHLPEKVRSHVREILAYPSDSVGAVMTTKYLAFDESMTARDVIKKLRTAAKRGQATSYAYVTTEDEILVGGNAALGLVIAMGMIVNLIAAGIAGASIPIGLKTLGLDPAQCSSIVLTTVTDVVGFFAFLGFAVLFQSHLG